MKNVTVIYLPSSSNGLQSFHVQKVTKRLREQISICLNILEQTRTIGANEFKIYIFVQKEA